MLDFLSRWDSSSLYPLFHCFPSWQGREERHGSLQHLLMGTVRNVFKEELLSKLQRKTAVKGKCVPHEFQLSFLIIPSGSRIYSSRNQGKSGPSKQKLSWIWHGLGATCRGWGDLVQWHIAMSNRFVRPLPLSLRLFRSGASHGAVGVRGQASHSVGYYPSALLGAADSVCSAICFCPADVTTIPPPRRWSFQRKEIFSLLLLTFSVYSPSLSSGGSQQLGTLPILSGAKVSFPGRSPFESFLKKEPYLL